jgi:uncharacterized protein (TIGR00730 family)
MNNTKHPSNHARLVAVFGSAGSQPGSVDWQAAYAIGRHLAGAGYDLLTGGYSGVMEAASQGAAEVGGHVVGGTVGMFEQRGLRPNAWVQEIVQFETLRERLYFLVNRPDAIIAVRGGVGTLSEVTLVWSLLQVGELSARPFVLVGPMWRSLVAAFAGSATIGPNDLRLLTLVDEPDEVVPALEAWWADPPRVPLRLGDVQPGQQ